MKKAWNEPSRVLVIDGSPIHNVGELQMHLFNWGEWGSHPGTAERFSFAPSAQWPAGSGVEYLFAAGLWIGAIRGGVPAVSTATFEHELRPRPDPRDILYRSGEGAPGGHRLPSPRADDDGDGKVDEDWLDGYDNDGDGQIDEDFAAISRLMYTCKYSDTELVSRQIYPEHNPLHILIRQESYQWSSPRLDDFVAVEYHITNIGTDVLQDLYVGMFVDGDVGPRTQQNYWKDDLTARRNAGDICVALDSDQAGAAKVDIAYFYDADGDNGRTPGRFGVMFLDHTTDPTGLRAPTQVGIASYAHFSGQQAFAFGGDPTNDFERYEVLSRRRSDPNADLPRDYRMLISAGPFGELDPDSTIVLQLAFVVGGSENEMITNGANAQLAYQGLWFDLDRDPMTGIEGRETPVEGPTEGEVWEDICRKPARLITDEGGCDTDRQDRHFGMAVRHLDEGEILWTNADCNDECLRKSVCGFTEIDSFLFRTGVGGRETRVPWLVRAAPPPPNIRADDHAGGGVAIYWDNFSETVPPITRFLDGGSKFEGYRLWRAENWTRPLGSSVATGPGTELWSTVFRADVINNFGEDTGIDQLRYEPLTHLLTTSRKRELIESIKAHLIEFPDRLPPCPQGVTAEVCDTLEALARWELGLDGGRQYYRYIDRAVVLGTPYFYAVVAYDHDITPSGALREGLVGDPASNFIYVEPKTPSQPLHAYSPEDIYLVPNPVTARSMYDWTLGPTNQDPTGTKVEFRNLPAAAGVIRVYTLAGDLVQELPFDARTGVGTLAWDLVSRNGQDITSGVYLYAVEFHEPRLARVIKKFTVIR